MRSIGRFLTSNSYLIGTVSMVVLLFSTVTFGQAPLDQYLVEFSGNKLPNDLSARVAALGGTIVDTMPGINVAIVANMTNNAAAALAAQSDVLDVTEDEFVHATYRIPRRETTSVWAAIAPLSVSDPSAAMYYPFQWDKRAIRADKAWQAGYHGDPNVRVAMIDTGMDPTHPELVGLIDASRSKSFCPEDAAIVAEQFSGYPDWTDLYGHGTFTAAIVSSNSNLLAGVTSRTTLLAIKTLSIVPCRSSGLTRAIYYAANEGADVINLSQGTGLFPRTGTRNYIHYVHRAIQYALVKGVSAVVVAAGNDAIDFDHSGNLVEVYCDVPGVICVSATGPTDSGPLDLGPFVNIDASAFYTNFGASAIDVAAPGGNVSFDDQGNVIGISYVHSACATTDRWFDSMGNVVPGFCTSNGITTAGNIGTSFAAPQVAGLSALLVSRLGHGHSAQVRAAIENSADDLGTPGADPFYGKGRINVSRALGIP